MQSEEESAHLTTCEVLNGLRYPFGSPQTGCSPVISVDKANTWRVLYVLGLGRGAFRSGYCRSAHKFDFVQGYNQVGEAYYSSHAVISLQRVQAHSRYNK